jgi:hypothetical protein
VLEDFFPREVKKLYIEHKISCLPDRQLGYEDDIYSVDLVIFLFSG